ncbi:BZ3500_MvSof-1268-A1-R1_Chr10-2g02965 [Microbotryum saponariae]|uniref:BZ3500_MvSof-1268-A1-R1_Chr10-2g02965 protein n=1 Tax=Microbotryum saponariae TaxID=289078 RepID=A0A2X0LYX1_9BASI|nr:BZ3501_MvSof-1269-A2-R1_Chr10-2g02551 [Microbotryum saponariae]SDA01835.1 BZ3500_MvSof-1268-A1-R1_Chr10-2g02965 [Microbotryum saponariae]
MVSFLFFVGSHREAVPFALVSARASSQAKCNASFLHFMAPFLGVSDVGDFSAGRVSVAPHAHLVNSGNVTSLKFPLLTCLKNAVLPEVAAL